MAGMVWCLAFLFYLSVGGAALPAAGEAAVATAGGLAAWAIYWGVSGREHWVAIVMLAMSVPIRHIAAGPPIVGTVRETVTTAGILIIAAAVVGLIARGIAVPAYKRGSEVARPDGVTRDVMIEWH